MVFFADEEGIDVVLAVIVTLGVGDGTVVGSSVFAASESTKSLLAVTREESLAFAVPRMWTTSPIFSFENPSLLRACFSS